SSELGPAVTTPPRFRHRSYAFDASIVVSLQSSSCLSPDLVLARPFPSALTTMAFDHSRRRWFGTCSCKPIPRGLPSSVEQQGCFELSVYMTYSSPRRRGAQSSAQLGRRSRPLGRCACARKSVHS